MNNSARKCASVAAGICWMMLTGIPALADDTEIFVGSSASAGIQPNVLFIIDTSYSMNSEITTQPNYDPTTTYSGSCVDTRTYWSNDATPPNCSTYNYFNTARLACDAAVTELAAEGYYEPPQNEYLAMYDDNVSFSGDAADRWENFSWWRHDDYVECSEDGGIHGNGGAALYAQDNDDSNLWTSDPFNEVAWGTSPVNNSYFLFNANYVNWYYGTTVSRRKIDIVKDVTYDLVDSLNGVNVGLMTFNNDEGGPIVAAIEDVATARSSLLSTISAIDLDFWTPLSEVLYEAGLYFRGAGVDYGNVQGPPNSVLASRQGSSGTAYNTYNSPITETCQQNYIVMLTDGMPTQDSSANSKITGQPDFATATGSGSCSGSGNGQCLNEQAAYLYNADLIADSTLAGTQSVTTFMVGFDYDDDPVILQDTADSGGGEYVTADDTATLTSELTNIITSILDTETTFSAPTVSINSFNRTRNLNDLFVAVFQPGGQEHWPGNLKKYHVDPSSGDIVDVNGDPAVDSDTGFFTDTSQSYWSSGVDGADVSLGGAANELPAPASRNLYTYLGNANLTVASNDVDPGNNAIDAYLGLGSPGDPAADDVLNFARGMDVTDIDGDGDMTEARNQMGDPLHAQPATVIYGGTSANPDIDDAAVFFATNDGYLHAIDPATGEELWAFIPPDFLPDLAALYNNEATSDKRYGIDGNPVIQMVGDSDGIVETGESVYLYFGMRRGGNFLYALDVTNKTQPQFMWRIDGSTLPNAGQSWSTPTPTRVSVSGASQDADKLVLIFGGGYDVDQDDPVALTDNVGNAVYMVDSKDGTLLWHASSSGSNLDLADMNYSMPGRVRVIDMNFDGFADRMYAADMGGQVWRFDILNDSAADDLVNGGVLAQLGAAAVSGTPTASDSRRFYYSPDAAVVSGHGPTFIHLGIGSGHRASPTSAAAVDRFYSIRDSQPFGYMTRAQYGAITPITDTDLVDITDDITTPVPEGSDGWKLELRLNGSAEKVLAEARTFSDEIFFTTFQPGGTSSSCVPSLGTNRLYVLDVVTGAPVRNLDGSVDGETLTESDRFTEFNGSIASEVVFLFPSPEGEDTDGDGIPDDPPPTDACTLGEDCTPPTLVCYGLECFPAGDDPVVRTFWSQENIY